LRLLQNLHARARSRQRQLAFCSAAHQVRAPFAPPYCITNARLRFHCSSPIIPSWSSALWAWQAPCRGPQSGPDDQFRSATFAAPPMLHDRAPPNGASHRSHTGPASVRSTRCGQPLQESRPLRTNCAGRPTRTAQSHALSQGQITKETALCQQNQCLIKPNYPP
jgi:hypothetical protein